MDYRCDPEFWDFKTVLYGHNMLDGSMFGGLKRFKNTVFLIFPDG